MKPTTFSTNLLLKKLNCFGAGLPLCVTLSVILVSPINSCDYIE